MYPIVGKRDSWDARETALCAQHDGPAQALGNRQPRTAAPRSFGCRRPAGTPAFIAQTMRSQLLKRHGAARGRLVERFRAGAFENVIQKQFAQDLPIYGTIGRAANHPKFAVSPLPPHSARQRQPMWQPLCANMYKNRLPRRQSKGQAEPETQARDVQEFHVNYAGGPDAGPLKLSLQPRSLANRVSRPAQLELRIIPSWHVVSTPACC